MPDLILTVKIKIWDFQRNFKLIADPAIAVTLQAWSYFKIIVIPVVRESIRILTGVILILTGIYLMYIKETLPIIAGISLVSCGLVISPDRKWLPEKISRKSLQKLTQADSTKLFVIVSIITTVITGAYILIDTEHTEFSIFIFACAYGAYRCYPGQLSIRESREYLYNLPTSIRSFFSKRFSTKRSIRAQQ